MKVGSLFAGVGGICLGFELANSRQEDNRFELLWANEIDKYASQTYRHNFNHRLLEGDIRKILNPKIELPKNKDENEGLDYIKSFDYMMNNPIDILTAGFPCQAFSIAGRREGFNDHRGNLFYSITDLLDEYSNRNIELPRILLLENVKNLEGHDDGNTFRIIRREIEERGYHIRYKVLNSYLYTEVPQNRERIYIVCFKEEKDYHKFELFDDLNQHIIERTENLRVRHIKRILDHDVSLETHRKYYYTREKYPHYFITEEEYNKMSEEDRRNNRINLSEEITEEYEFYQLRRGMYVRQNQTGVCPTLTANMGTGGHNVPLILVNDGIRKLTPKETFSLQGFPVDSTYELPERYEDSNRPFADGRLYKQAGNAVTVPIVTLIAKEILKIL